MHRLALSLFLVGCYAAHERPHDASVDAVAVPDAAAPCDRQDATRTDAWRSCQSGGAFFWDGARCGWAGTCSCAGADCASGYEDFDACIDAHAHCLPPVPCLSASDCDVSAYCQHTSCGAAGFCRPRPFTPLDCGFEVAHNCGCAGTPLGFGNRCRAHIEGDDGPSC